MKTKFNKSIIGLALVGALVGSFTSCKKDDDGNGDQAIASLSIVNAVEGSATQDVYLNDSKATTAAYGSAASEVNTTTATRTISFKNAGTTTESASASLTLDASVKQTVYLTKLANGSLTVSTYGNTAGTPGNGKARVRFINLAPLLTSTINVTTSAGANLVSGLAFRATSAYEEVNAATSFNVTMAGSLEVTTISGTEIQAGKVYTIWLDSSTTTKAKYHIVVEN
jgi:hypothetical protein